GLSSPVTAAQSSWSASSDRQLGHAAQQDSQDRVYPVRSLLTLDPNKTPSEKATRRSGSISDSTATAYRPSMPRADTAQVPPRPGPSSTGETVRSGSSVTSPPSYRFRQHRQNTVSAPMSSVQADAERYGS